MWQSARLLPRRDQPLSNDTFLPMTTELPLFSAEIHINGVSFPCLWNMGAFQALVEAGDDVTSPLPVLDATFLPPAPFFHLLYVALYSSVWRAEEEKRVDVAWWQTGDGYPRGASLLHMPRRRPLIDFFFASPLL